MLDYEKLGVFYLGCEYHLNEGKRGDGLILYDSRDLVTHAVCVGMTGSGKTGLCIGLIEEAAIDSIPAIIIDPKGDLSNLLLTFPNLAPEDFQPWVNEEDARKKGLSTEQFAEAQAALWRKGLGEWGQDADRIRRLREAVDLSIYTPGSSAGIPVSILKSFACPDASLREDRDFLNDRISSTATSLLALLGIEADPVRSREHMLLSTLLAKAWEQGTDLDLASLIQQIQSPPVTRVGVMDLEAFYPASDRFALAMRINGLLASPGFASWMEGDPLDIGSVLHTPEGKPRIGIFSISHLGDVERMFFVTNLLHEVLGWMRRQPGTTSLRAILYMDEIAGYCPPVASVPSKAPLLTLMKQARAFGLGVVLATQNPVDLDYKGLSNAGTWFIGRLQTDRDKARVIEGLEGASAASGGEFDRKMIEETLSKLTSRVFLMKNVHENHPVVFETRWALSYLRGPLTRDQIRTLMQERKRSQPEAKEPTPISSAAGPVTSAPVQPLPVPSGTGSRTNRPPILPPGIGQVFAPVHGTQPGGTSLVYKPSLFGSARISFSDAKLGVDHEHPYTCLAPFGEGPVVVDWLTADPTSLAEEDLSKEPESGGTFASLPPVASVAKSYPVWKKDFVDAIVRGQALEVLYSPAHKVASQPVEAEREFRLRIQQLAREKRDDGVEKLRQKYTPKMAGLQERLRKAEQALEVQKGQARDAKMTTAFSLASTLLSAVLGRKSVSVSTLTRGTTAARGISRSMREAGDVERAGENMESIRQQLEELENEFTSESARIAEEVDSLSETLEKVSIKPKKTQVSVRLVTLVWMPRWVGQDGNETFAWG